MPTRVHKDQAHAREMNELAEEDVTETKGRTGCVTADAATDWLDSIDDALEEWAESNELAAAFVAAYQQKGGE